MRAGARQGVCAVVVVDVEPDADAGGRPRMLDELAATWRGEVHEHGVEPTVVVFAGAPRAVGFAQALRHAAPGVRIGVHVGEVQARDATVVGAGVSVARSLATQAAAGQVRTSLVLRDLVAELPDTRFVESTDPPAGPDGPPVFELVDVTSRDLDADAATHGLAELVDAVEGVVTTTRLVVVTARPGTGKTTVLRGVADRHPTVWLAVPPAGLRPAVFARSLVDGLRVRVPGLAPALTELAGGVQAGEDGAARAETLAATIAGALAPRLPQDLLVVVDGADDLTTDDTCRALLDALVRNAPHPLHVVLLGRRDPGLRTARLAGSGEVATLDDGDLRLADEAMADLVARRLGVPSDDERVQRAVAAVDGHVESALLWSARSRRGHEAGHGAGALARALVRDADEVESAVLTALGSLGRASVGLLQHLVGVPLEDVVARLRADGLVRPVGTDSTLVELGASTVATVAVAADDRRRTCVAAGEVLRADGDVSGALRLLRHGKASEACLQLVREEGRRLLAGGDWPTVLDAVDAAAGDPEAAVDGGPADAALAGLVGEAWRLAGDQSRAVRWFTHATQGDEQVPAWVAWRLGMLLHFGGELEEATALYRRAVLAGEPADVALVHAWDAAAAWMQGELDRCREAADRALLLATDAGDDRALAAAHTVRALLAASDGDRVANDRWYLRALQHAESAGDLLQVVRIRTNRGSRLLEEGEHVAALAELEEALGTADLIGALQIQAMALSNRGQVLARLGRLDEATADVVGSRELFERAGSRWVGYALCHLGDLHRIRGERALALSAYRGALAQAEPVRDTQGTVPAMTGLALLALDRDPAAARAWAERACAHPDTLGHVAALAALAEVALAQGDVTTAVATVRTGTELARRRRDRPGLAQLLELQARTVADDVEAEALLREAQHLWDRMACPLESARLDVAVAARVATPASRAAAERAVQTLRAHGARTLADHAERVVDDLRAAVRAPVHLRVLGSLELEAGGVPLPDGALPGPDVRDLLVHQVVHRHDAMPRARVATTLFADDPDPEGRLARAESGLAALLQDLGVADDEGIAAVSSDLDRLRAGAAQGLAAVRGGAPGAEAHLLAAEAAHRGELYEDREPVPWLLAARDDTAETYLQVVMALVDLAERDDDHHRAVRLLLRVLERDPFDEGAHLRLVACLERAGRRGEARRRYRGYSARMQEIGVEPAPFPDLTPASTG